MKHISDTLRVLIFTLFGIVLTVIVYQALNRLSVKDNRQTYRIYAEFDDLKQLQIGDDVRLAGVRIGSVTDTSLRNNLAIATLSIENKFAVPSDSVATVAMAGLLGANYVAVVPGNHPQPLQPNGNLQTQNPSNIEEVIQKFGSVGERLDRILSSFDGKNIGDDLFGGLKDIGNFFRDNREKLSQIINRCSEITQNVQSITQQVSEGHGTLGKLVRDEQVYQRITDMLQSLSNISKRIESGQGLVGKLIYDPKTSQSFDTLMNNLKEFSARLNDERSTLGRIISDDALYKKAEAALDKVDGAVNSISNSGPVTAVGAAASALF